MSSFRAETHIGLLGSWTGWVGKGKQQRKPTMGKKRRKRLVAVASGESRERCCSTTAGHSPQIKQRMQRLWMRGLCTLFGHEFFGFGDGFFGRNFAARLVDIMDVEGGVENEDGGAGLRAGAFSLMDVLGGEIAVVAIGENDRLFVLHGDFKKASQGNRAFRAGMPVPGNDAAGSELDFDDRSTFARIAAQDRKRRTIRNTRKSGVFLTSRLADNRFVGILG